MTRCAPSRLAACIVVEEQAARRPMTVVIAPVAEEVVAETATDITSNDAPSDRVIARPPVEPSRGSDIPVRLVAVPAGA